MPIISFHTICLFILNSSLIILTPLIQGTGDYLAFTLIFLSTNLLILSFIWQVVRHGSFTIVFSPLFAISFIFLGVIFLSFFYTINPPSTRYGFFTMASVIINSTFLSFIMPKERLWKGLFAVLAITVFLLSIMALYQHISGHSNFMGRAHATFVNPNSFSGYLLLTMPLCIGAYLVVEKTGYVSLFFGLTMFSFCALLATGTEGRWITLIAAVVVAMVLLWAFVRLSRKRLGALAAGFLIAFLLFAIPMGSGKEIFTPNEKTLSGVTLDRLNIWKSTFAAIKEHPIRGAGFWSFHTIYTKYKNEVYKNVEHYFSHNDYLQFWAELGLIGVGVFLLLIAVYFREGFRCLKYLKPDNSASQNIPSPCGRGLRGGGASSDISPSPQPSPVKGERARVMLLSTLIGSFLLLVHTIGDFDLYIPAILFIFWGYIAYTASTTRELRLCTTKIIDLNQFRIFTILGRKKLYIISAGIFAFLSFWVSDPYLAGLHNERGMAYLARGKYDSAVKFFSKATILDPIDDSYHFNLGLALAKSSSGDSDILTKAEEEMKKALALAPYRSEIYSNLANFYREFYLKEKAHIAVEFMKKARELDPNEATIIHNLGLLYLQMGSYEDAVSEFSRYLKEYPNDLPARIELIEAYRLNKRYDHAEREIDWILGKNSDYNYNYAHFLKAGILGDMKKYEEAHNEYRLALREKGKESDVWYAIGQLFLKQKKQKSAEEAFRKALEFNKDDLKSINALGNLYLKQGKKREAVEKFKESLSINHEQPEIKLLLDRKERQR